MKILYICGSLNQTRMMHKVSLYMQGYDLFFTPYYCDGFEKFWLDKGILEFTVMGGKFFSKTMNYLEENKLSIDYEARKGPYDLVVTCSDLIVPKNVMVSKLVLVQEGMTDPEGILYYFVKWLKLPRWLASTSTTGLSNLYDLFCVASNGYAEFFMKKGVNANKIRITGIPNFDNCAEFKNNDFPFADYVLVATSDRREIYRYENRKKFIKQANKIANGRQLIFKFHPNENMDRARREVEKYSPEAITFTEGNTDHMIANCNTLITKFSSVVFVAMALGKKLISDIPSEELKLLLPIQNGGRSAYNIAMECLKLLEPTFSKSETKIINTASIDRRVGAGQSG